MDTLIIDVIRKEFKDNHDLFIKASKAGNRERCRDIMNFLKGLAAASKYISPELYEDFMPRIRIMESHIK